MLECDVLCIGQITKADISQGTGGAKMSYEIRISDFIYIDSNFMLLKNLKALDKINIQTIHNTFGYKNFSKLFKSYLILLDFDPSTIIYINNFAVELIWFENEEFMQINKKEFNKLKSAYYNNGVSGFIDDYTNSQLYEDLIPKEIKQYKLTTFDLSGRKQSFVPLNNFLEYFFKIKNIKKD
jgi:hypothetical protein